MMKFRILLLRKIDSVWLIVILNLYIHIPFYVWAAQYTENIETRFQQFIVENKRTYARNSTEYAKRLAIFAANVKLQKELNHNRGNAAIGDKFSTAWYGVNKFSDLSPEEFRAQYLTGLMDAENHIRPLLKANGFFHRPQLLIDVPKKHDWREKGIISSPRDQKNCGGCWAFAAVETVESMYALRHGSHVTPLSIQETLDCSYAYGRILYSCYGGDTCIAFDWMNTTRVRLVTEAAYPLKDSVAKCSLPAHNQTAGVTVKGFTCNSYAHREFEMLKLLSSYGPLTVGVDASNWVNYQGGIIQYHCGEVTRNHAVQIVGYDLTGPIPYYIVRNSWGTDFGHDGYVYVKYGNNTCVIADRVSTVAVQ